MVRKDYKFYARVRQKTRPARHYPRTSHKPDNRGLDFVINVLRLYRMPLMCKERQVVMSSFIIRELFNHKTTISLLIKNCQQPQSNCFQQEHNLTAFSHHCNNNNV